jgi:hypothetical protein
MGCGAGAGFLQVLRFPLPIFIPPIAPQSPSSNTWGLYNRPEVAAVPSGLSPTPLITTTTIIIIIIIIIPWRKSASYPLIHWIGGWVGPRTSMNNVERRKILDLPGLEL